MTPGSGVTLMCLSRASEPGGVPSRMTGVFNVDAVSSMAATRSR